MGYTDKDGNYHLMCELKIGHEVKVNDHYIRVYNPIKKIIDAVYIVIDISGNMIRLDKTIPGHDGNNFINRYFLDRYKSNIVKRLESDTLKPLKVKTVPSPNKTIIPKKEELPEKVEAQKIETKTEEPELKPVVPIKELTILEQLELELENNKNGFFEIDVTQIQSDYINKVNKMKISGYEKNKLIEKIKQLIKKF